MSRKNSNCSKTLLSRKIIVAKCSKRAWKCSHHICSFRIAREVLPYTPNLFLRYLPFFGKFNIFSPQNNNFNLHISANIFFCFCVWLCLFWEWVQTNDENKYTGWSKIGLRRSVLKWSKSQVLYYYFIGIGNQSVAVSVLKFRIFQINTEIVGIFQMSKCLTFIDPILLSLLRLEF